MLFCRGISLNVYSELTMVKLQVSEELKLKMNKWARTQPQINEMQSDRNYDSSTVDWLIKNSKTSPKQRPVKIK